MASFKYLFLFCVICMWSLGCDAPNNNGTNDNLPNDQTNSNKADKVTYQLDPQTGRVKLLRASVVIGSVNSDGKWIPHQPPLNDFGYGAKLVSFARGVLAVNEPGEEGKEVVVYYQSEQSNQPGAAWKTVKAEWITDNIWEFRTDFLYIGGSFHYIPKAVHRFAIVYRFNGQEYWDNKQGWNYSVSGGDSSDGWVPMDFGPPVLLNAGDLIVEQAYYDGAYLKGSVLLRNIAYQKKVEIVYSTDDWNTFKYGEAFFEKPLGSAPDLERWRFELLAPSTNAEAVVFAVSLEANSFKQWDNNFGRNYRIRLDGIDSPWAMGPPLSVAKLIFEGIDKIQIAIATVCMKLLQRSQVGA